MGMPYEKALRIGRRRAEAAAALLDERTGLASQPVCSVRDLQETGCSVPEPDRWAPVGKEDFADIAVLEHRGEGQKALILVVDELGTAKACSWGYMSVRAAVLTSELLKLPVSRAEGSRLRQLLDAKALTDTVRSSTLRMDV